MVDILDAAHQAAGRHDWAEAVSLFREAAEKGRFSASDYELFGLSAWWVSNVNLCVEAREKAYAMYLADGRTEDAGRIALQLSENYHYLNAKSISNRWYNLAKQHLENHKESTDYGWLIRHDGYVAFETDGPAVALKFAEEALAIAIQSQNRDLEYLCRQDIGRYNIAQGNVKKGLEAMESSMLPVMTGNADPMTSGKLLCNMIEICDELVDYQRALEWDTVARNWCARVGQHSGFPGVCRIKRAGLMKKQGAWEEAEKEALKARQELIHFTPFAARALYEVGEIRLRLGDYEKAGEAFREAHALGLNPHPGLAMLYDVQGKTAAAFELLESALAEIHMPLLRIPNLTALGVLALKLNKISVAEETYQEIEKTAKEYESPAIQASALHLKGLISLCRKDYQGALDAFKATLSYWLSIGLPYEISIARMHVAQALFALGRVESARLEWDTVLREFVRLGAKPDIEKVQKALMQEKEVVSTNGVRKAMMFTDIVGSTALIGLIGDAAWRHLVQWHDRTLRALFEAHRGREVEQAGDGFFVEFETSHDAVECAQEIQRTLYKHRTMQGFAPNVRIGIHCAEVSYSGSTPVGLEVHKAARIASLADAGQIAASFEITCDVGDLPVSEKKSVQVKGIAEPVEVVFVEWKDGSSE
jgi:class 3 adenylate cyclase